MRAQIPTLRHRCKFDIVSMRKKKTCLFGTCQTGLHYLEAEISNSGSLSKNRLAVPTQRVLVSVFYKIYPLDHRQTIFERNGYDSFAKEVTKLPVQLEDVESPFELDDLISSEAYGAELSISGSSERY